ncbi:SH3 domain-binding glutamic acid-rich-like protein 3 [Orbicella faveolata]|uniref:SH3 domain-binding glutamic acid-rich-like protein 3 n=1 Tax=Orbicella faveolata TaxID=48498 RepID=UPI0009E35F99|nr:SH3 domain-binding glutamic acid-rich-like protein 3 [Orbicella faveolata]
MGERIVYYYSSVSSNLELKKQQQKIEMILDSKRVDYDKVDIAGNDEAKQKMREVMGDPKGLPPQLIKGNTHLGGYAEFEEAVESEELLEFLKLK